MAKWSESQKRYAASIKGCEARRRYQQSEKGRATHKAYLARRKTKIEEAKQASVITAATPTTTPVVVKYSLGTVLEFVVVTLQKSRSLLPRQDFRREADKLLTILWIKNSVLPSGMRSVQSYQYIRCGFGNHCGAYDYLDYNGPNIRYTYIMPIPHNRQHLFWSKNVRELDTVTDRPYITHQTLAFGTLDDWKWLRTLYPLVTIRRTFTQESIKLYTPSAYNFAKKILGVSDRDAPADRYDKTFPRHIG